MVVANANGVMVALSSYLICSLSIQQRMRQIHNGSSTSLVESVT